MEKQGNRKINPLYSLFYGHPFSFLLASVMLTLSPGPDLLMVIAQSIEKGTETAFFVCRWITHGPTGTHCSFDFWLGAIHWRASSGSCRYSMDRLCLFFLSRFE